MPIPLLELTHKLGLFEATLGTIDLLVPLSLSQTTKGMNLGCHKRIFVLFLFTFANKSKNGILQISQEHCRKKMSAAIIIFCISASELDFKSSDKLDRCRKKTIFLLKKEFASKIYCSKTVS